MTVGRTVEPAVQGGGAAGAATAAPVGPSARVADAVVEVEGLVKRYGDRRVLDGVSLALGRGEVVALLGPNGAGKTTTVEILEGYRRADGGRVRVLGTDPATGGRELRARIGLMLQGGGGIDPRARPLETIRLHATFHAPSADPDALLDLVGLRAVARTPFRRLSGGERQRLAVALALAGDPELLILDEPTAGMDPAARAGIRELIRARRDAGVGVLLTTHDLTDVERTADRVAILHDGRIVAEGSPASLAGAGTAELRFRLASPVAGDALAALGSAIGALSTAIGEVRPTADPLAYRVAGVVPGPGVVATLARWAEAHDVLIADLSTAPGSLEERYLALTGDRAVEAS